MKAKGHCPFCGTKSTQILGPPDSTHSKGYQIECINCGSRGPCGMASPYDAIAVWDKGDVGYARSKDTPADTHTLTDRLAETLRESDCRKRRALLREYEAVKKDPCSHCGGSGEIKHTETTPNGYPLQVVNICPVCMAQRRSSSAGAQRRSLAAHGRNRSRCNRRERGFYDSR